jgi:3-methyladenine DNA glycosylase AlkC
VGAFKDQISARLADELARELAAAWPGFPRRRFTAGVAAALEPLELMARISHLAGRLGDTMPEGFDEAASVLWRALASPSFTGWMTAPVNAFVARAGIDRPEAALPLLAGLTSRFSSEFAIRSFIEQHRDIAYDHLRGWCTHPDEHVRRLVSEGTRPRLPWAAQLRDLVADPSPNIPLLDALSVDPSPYVRRSVANHLNDIVKDHPDVALDLAARWAERGTAGSWVARHGLRTLIKRGDPRALRLLDVDPEAEIRLERLAVMPSRLPIGGDAVLQVALSVPGSVPVDAVIDYRVHYLGARGARAPKVFKLTRRRIEPGEPVVIDRRHAFADVSIRRLHAGPHTIDVQVNGRVMGSVSLELTDPAST